MPRPLLAATALLCAVAAPSLAHHRQTPPIVPFSDGSDGSDATLSRMSGYDGAFAAVLANGLDRRVVRYKLTGAFAQTVIVDGGTNHEPAESLNGAAVVFASEADPLGTGAGGSQIYRYSGTSEIIQLSADPTGTSRNPAISGTGGVVAWESQGDLADTANHGSHQVFLRGTDGVVTQLSRGAGNSANAALDKFGRRVAFESTSDYVSGNDLGIPWVWVADLLRATVTPLTIAFGPSRHPAISSEGQIVVFESSADLAGTRLDTGIPQIFAHDLKSGTTAQLTRDPAGCTAPSVHPFRTDWRIAFLCNGTPYYFLLRADERYRVQVDGGETSQVLAAMGPQFLLLTTTAPLAGGQPTAARQMYLVNLYHRPAEPVAGTAVWFPTRGLLPLKRR